MTIRQIGWALKMHDDARRVLKNECQPGGYIILRANPYVLQMALQRVSFERAQRSLQVR